MSLLISIGMPICNRLVEMIKALDSILNQTYINFELIISNDNFSNPEIDIIVRRYVDVDNRIRYFKQENSIRTVENYSFVFKKVTGNYFMWLVDYDWVDSNFIENAVSFLENNFNFRKYIL